MSWPTDGRARFVVATVDGFRKPPKGNGASKVGRSWIVRDRAQCHAKVVEYHSEAPIRTYPPPTREQKMEQWARTATEHAERLNAEHAVAHA